MRNRFMVSLAAFTGISLLLDACAPMQSTPIIDKTSNFSGIPIEPLKPHQIELRRQLLFSRYESG